MPGIATGEVFAFPEGKLYAFASAAGTVSGSGIGFAENARLTFVYGWMEWRGAGGAYHRAITGQRADLDIGYLFGDTQMWRLVNNSAAVNLKFEGLVTAVGVQSAVFALYSGVGDSFDVSQADGQTFKARASFHANEWSAFGG